MARDERTLLIAPAFVGGIITAVLMARAGSIASCIGDDCFGRALELVFYGVPIALALSWLVLAFATGAWRAPVVTVLGAIVVCCLLKLVTVTITTPDPPPFWAGALLGAAGFTLVAAAFLPRIPSWLRTVVALGTIALSLWGAGSA
ncbi:hypothetical protein Acy02nite_49830 [Actinoplanes cyaneus]|uniref:Uncharacterized protein n=1 Tax=Actinoplanes cyaneus TaxID=52696 RepID=A0A919M5W6_9ACTN|nr:hypothetical protein [Actinoplanes cyaneus]MCW2141041.1 hypothetical protein [Actinoplanes cyaneus]GID67102.1 hypothetical protein Acy02nite_49830 [Actinoplanes cyaneus]